MRQRETVCTIVELTTCEVSKECGERHPLGVVVRLVREVVAGIKSGLIPPSSSCTCAELSGV
jgi:hypothetical protein